MTNDQTVTQADERAADEWYPDRSATMHRKLAKLLARHRTAHSGEGREDAEHCRKCGRDNPSWSAPSPLWNAVMRGGSIDGNPIHDDLVCPSCFIGLAMDAGIASGWRLIATDVNVLLETVTPSGRVWDDAAFLWDEQHSSHSGEGRSNGAGEDIAERLKQCPRIEDARILAPGDRVAEIVVPVSLRDDILAALSAPQGEVERLRAEVADYRKLTAEQQKRIGKLEGAIMARPPIKPDDGSWWYPEGDTSSDACCHGPAEALEGAADQMAEGEARVVVLERALELPNVYAALRVFTDAERDERDDDEPWDFTLHATADDARAALAQPEAGGER